MAKSKDPYAQTQAYLERLKRRTYRNVTPQVFGSNYCYVWGFTKKGKPVVWGPYMERIEADRDLATLEEGEIFELVTRDLAKATREIKSELAQRLGDPDEALRRVTHKKPNENEAREKRLKEKAIKRLKGGTS